MQIINVGALKNGELYLARLNSDETLMKTVANVAFKSIVGTEHVG